METLPENNLEQTLKQALFDTLQLYPPYPGYPSVRLNHTNPAVAQQLTEGAITLLPEGPWNAGTAKLQTPPTKAQGQRWRAEGYAVDILGRPLHPWLGDMLQHKHIGVVTGTGAYWNMGPNKTADPIIFAHEGDETYLFLVKRADNGLWALPGGFIDPGENAAQAATREAFEEGGILLSEPSAEIYSGVVADMRTTAYAWAETTALVFQVESRQTAQLDRSEVSDGAWFSIDFLPDEFHGSHKVLVQQAVNYENI